MISWRYVAIMSLTIAGTAFLVSIAFSGSTNVVVPPNVRIANKTFTDAHAVRRPVADGDGELPVGTGQREGLGPLDGDAGELAIEGRGDESCEKTALLGRIRGRSPTS
mgnify:CR=1 FL=1